MLLVIVYFLIIVRKHYISTINTVMRMLYAHVEDRKVCIVHTLSSSLTDS